MVYNLPTPLLSYTLPWPCLYHPRWPCLRLLHSVYSLPAATHTGGEAPGLNAGGLVWIHDALYGSEPWTTSPATARCGPSLPSVQILKSYIWVALFIALAGNILEYGRERSVLWRIGCQPNLKYFLHTSIVRR